MSCWVVPSVAAELWGISVNQVLDQVHRGQVPSKSELGFTLVDVAPNGPRMEAGRRQPGQRPMTFVAAPVKAKIADESDEPELVELTDEEEAALNASVDQIKQVSWTSRRQSASRLRHAPANTLSAAA